jgi:uncharacterized protein (DUF305 family)
MTQVVRNRTKDPKVAAPAAGIEDAQVPGMATTAQFNALRTARGALDRMFRQLMPRHHQGGQRMLADAAAHAGIEAVRAVAARMAFDRRQETQTAASLRAGK